jgi:hypothetical protein
MSTLTIPIIPETSLSFPGKEDSLAISTFSDSLSVPSSDTSSLVVPDVPRSTIQVELSKFDYIDDLSGVSMWTLTPPIARSPGTVLHVGYFKQTTACPNPVAFDRYDFSGIIVGMPYVEDSPDINDSGPAFGDFTGGGCTMISETFGITTAHFLTKVGWYWRGKSGAIYESLNPNTSTERFVLPWVNSNILDQLVKVRNPPPMWDCARYAIAGNLPQWPNGYRFLTVLHGSIIGVRTHTATNPSGVAPERYHWVNHNTPIDPPAVTHESGKPLFVAYNNELLLCGTQYNGSSQSWVGGPDMWDYWLPIMAADGEAPTFQNVDLA